MRKFEGKPRLIMRYRRVFIAVGTLFTFLGFIASVKGLFVKNGLFLNIILFLQGVWGLGVFLFAYGLAVIQGKRWHIFGLLIFVFFGSFVVGLLSLVGRETAVGYYIWSVGGVISLSLIIILIIYWDRLLDG